METNPARGHLAALLTIVIWGTTFISTKVLLVDFQPVEILFIRFMMGFLALLAVCPRRLQGVTRRQEGLFALAGLCGVCLYYLLENIALTYTMASNVGVIISVSPCFTALLTHFLMRGEERLRPHFSQALRWPWRGSALSASTALPWSWTSGGICWRCWLLRMGLLRLLSRKISALGHPTVLTTRRTFFYGLAFMLPALMVSGVRLELTRLTAPVNLGNLLFLGLGASAVLRHLELRGEGTGGGENQRVHLSGAGDHSGGLRADPAGTLHLDDRSRYGTDLIGLLLSEGKLHWKEGTHHETGTGQMRPGD